jgi:hypothetical protein
MPKLFLVCLSFLLSGVIYCQSVVFNPIVKDSLASDSIFYSISGFFEVTDSMEVQIDLVQIYPDSLHAVYSLSSGFDPDLNPTNNNLQLNPETGEFIIQCGVFNASDLMIRLLFFRNEEKIYETYYK